MNPINKTMLTTLYLTTVVIFFFIAICLSFQVITQETIPAIRFATIAAWMFAILHSMEAKQVIGTKLLEKG